MEVIPAHLMEALLDNGKASAQRGCTLDHLPLVRMVSADTGASWTLSERSPVRPDLAFGLFDAGDGSIPCMGWVSISELLYARSPSGRLLDRDQAFQPSRRIGACAAHVRLTKRLPSSPGA